jgi:hypothetical protein
MCLFEQYEPYMFLSVLSAHNVPDVEEVRACGSGRQRCQECVGEGVWQWQAEVSGVRR